MADPDNLDYDKIARQVRRTTELVPEIGEGRRWYDLPYNLLEHCYRVGRVLPRRARRTINQAQNRLRLYNSLDRAKVSHVGDPLYEINVPDGERVHLPMYWVAEMYSPSYASALEERLTKLAGTKADLLRVPGEEVGRQIKRVRQGDGGGPSHMVTVLSPENSRWEPGARRLALPPELEQIDVHLFSLGQSLTAIVAQIELSRMGAACLDRAIKSEHEPRLVKRPAGLSLDNRMFAGIEDVQAERQRLHLLGRQWLAQELPGIFATEGAGRLPLLDLLVTEVLDPFEDRGREFMNFTRAIGIDVHFTRETLRDHPRVMLKPYEPERERAEDTDLWSLVAKLEDGTAHAEPGEPFSRQDPRRLAMSLRWGAPHLLSRLALFSLLDLKRRTASTARDVAHRKHRGRPVASAKLLRESLLRSSLDLATIADDIEALTSNLPRYRSSVPEVMSVRINGADAVNEDPKDLRDGWAKRQAQQAKRLVELDRALSGLLDVASSLNASIESIRAQRWSVILSVVSAGAATAALWVAVETLARTP